MKSLTLPARLRTDNEYPSVKKEIGRFTAARKRRETKEKNVDFFLYLVFKEPTHARTQSPKGEL
ncbi:MAG: hypothetical protein GY769_21255 [bacterium]|nr:hypothetical protein [bacterium]